MPLIARQRSRLAVLAVLALVGSLLAVSAVPVAAEDGKADNEAMYSACVGAATGDAEFTDMDGSFAEDAANCLAHYSITKGTSEGVFSPNASVTRLQMALFLSRAAGPAGIVLPSASDQGFGDIGGMSDEIQDAINQIAELDIMAGRSDDEFDPAGMVTREDMAVHLAGFLSEATVGPGGTDIDAKTFKPDDTEFEDLGSVTFAAYGAIKDLFELGVTTGTTETMYSPDALVSRGQMAAFITRTLAHTNARPVGLTMQASDISVFKGDEVTLVASLRDRNHQPIANAPIDFFYLEGDDDEPFNDDGTCATAIDPVLGSECETEAGDSTTDSNGNVGQVTLIVNDDTTVWAWTGDLGDEFDDDDTDSVTVDISAAEAAMHLMVTDDRAVNAAKVKFGEEVTFTFQVVDKAFDPVAKKGVKVQVQSVITSMDGDTILDRTRTHETGTSGRIELSYSQDDPEDDDKSGDEALLSMTLKEPINGGVVGHVDGDGKKLELIADVVWDDDDAEANHLELTATRKYHEASGEGKGVGNTVRATLVDQYGDPISGALIRFRSSESATFGAPKVARHTNSGGVASLSYRRDSAGASEEKIYACYTKTVNVVDDENCESKVKSGKFDDDNDDDTPAVDDKADTLVSADTLRHYWANEASSDGTTGELIVVVDTANNTIVVNASAPIIVKYDSNDQFNVDGTAKVLADFEDALDVGDKLDWKFIYVMDEDGKRVKVNGNEVIDEGGVTVFKLRTV